MITPLSWLWYRIVGYRDDKRCRCGHNVELHEHYSYETDCSDSACSCRKFRARRERLTT